MVARNQQEPGKPTAPEETDAAAGDIERKDESLEELRARIKALEAENEKLAAAKDLAEEESARLSAQAQSSLLTSSVVERFAGKDEDGETDLWWYRIDIAPCGGDHIKINGKPYLHGHT